MVNISCIGGGMANNGALLRECMGRELDVSVISGLEALACRFGSRAEYDRVK